jgi:hypothetical protein
MATTLTLTAFRTRSPYDFPIVAAERWREWMNDTESRFANRCLPLLIANQSGWAILNPQGFRATWDGRDHQDGITLEWDEPNLPAAKPASTHFGHGVLTWGIPYLFRTPPGWNLLARGPANWPKDGVCALEGVIETDWLPATFTMNWKLTRPGQPVRFEPGEPICMVLPQRRGELESVAPSIHGLEPGTELHHDAKRWSEDRHQEVVRQFLAQYSASVPEDPDAPDNQYFRGRWYDGEKVPEHQTTLRLAPFADMERVEPGPERPARGAGPSADQ